MPTLDEAAARRVVLVQAFDAADSPLWTREDAAWATRLALHDAPVDMPPARLLAERARHALQRLEPRERGVRRWLARSSWRWPWALLAIALGAGAGLAADLLGHQQIVDVLAPAVWATIAWNAAVYLSLLWALWHHKPASPHAPGLVRRTLLAWWQRRSGRGPLRVATQRWAEVSAPLALWRVGALLHLAALGFAAGLIGGMYLRGLVLDYRAGWQSTFLDAATVQAALAALLSPASAVTGIAVPDAAAIDAMRLTVTHATSVVSAAAWIHLYAAMLLLTVALPRAALAIAALARAAWLSRRLPLPLDDPALLRELNQLQRLGGVVQVCPYAQAPGAQSALGLRTMLSRELGDDVQLRFATPTMVGDEEWAAPQLVADAVTLRVVLVDLGATPEDDHHGRFIRALRRSAPDIALRIIADESEFRRRFAGLQGRIDERRAAWRRFAAAQDVMLNTMALEQVSSAPSSGSPHVTTAP